MLALVSSKPPAELNLVASALMLAVAFLGHVAITKRSGLRPHRYLEWWAAWAWLAASATLLGLWVSVAMAGRSAGSDSIVKPAHILISDLQSMFLLLFAVIIWHGQPNGQPIPWTRIVWVTLPACAVLYTAHALITLAAEDENQQLKLMAHLSFGSSIACVQTVGFAYLHTFRSSLAFLLCLGYALLQGPTAHALLMPSEALTPRGDVLVALAYSKLFWSTGLMYCLGKHTRRPRYWGRLMLAAIIASCITIMVVGAKYLPFDESAAPISFWKLLSWIGGFLVAAIAWIVDGPAAWDKIVRFGRQRGWW